MDASTKQRIEQLISTSPVFVFMKGNKLMPQCGFSNNVVQILNSLGVAFETFDVLSDMEVRQGIKEFSEWPTIPQVYVNGEFMGGSDILIEMYNSGELREKLAVALALSAAGRAGSVPARFVEGAHVIAGADEAGRIHDPAVNQLLEAALGECVEHGRFAQGVQVPIGVETHLGGAVVAACQRLAGVAQRLEVADRVGMLQGGHGRTGWDSWQGIA